ncbi:hypothetical protein [Streptomyces atratus]
MKRSQSSGAETFRWACRTSR